MNSLFFLIDTVLTLYLWCILGSVILSWLIAFNVVNTSNRYVFSIGSALHRLTEPALGRIRRMLPNLGGLDLSPLVVILIVIFAKGLLAEYWPRTAYGM